MQLLGFALKVGKVEPGREAKVFRDYLVVGRMKNRIFRLGVATNRHVSRAHGVGGERYTPEAMDSSERIHPDQSQRSYTFHPKNCIQKHQNTQTSLPELLVVEHSHSERV